MEKRDLYDINRKLTGKTIYKNAQVPDGNYIIVVLIFIKNSKGEFLIQKRSKRKDGTYAFTGGHAKSGETSIQAMCTEVKEEIGITLREDELELIYSGRSDRGHVFFDLYYIERDFKIEDMVLQEEEVEFVEWCSTEKIRKLINDGVFKSNHIEDFFRMLDIFKKRGINLE